ncbi:MAG: TerD family protein [Selenomonadaceae bacterium]|nr:TerD family protein [Selenomonadaceae bacterium]
MKSIQQIVNSRNSKIDISMGEYEGPLRINRSCTIDGHGATLWAKGGTALIVDSAKVTINNLRVEITDHPEQIVAIKTRNDTVLKDVEVYGQEEINGTVSKWKLPRMLDFGSFAADKTNEFCREIFAERNCRIVNHVHGMDVKPQTISAGRNEVSFKVASLMNSTILYGDVILQTDYGVNKRIYISGRAVQGAPEVHEQKAMPESNVVGNGHMDGQDSGSRAINESSVPQLIKGQRISLGNTEKLFLGFQGEYSGLEVDPYAFLLYEDGKTRQDSDLIFFGNTQSESNGVYIDRVDGSQGVGICLKNVSKDVESIVVAFAVYAEDGNTTRNFSRVKNPKARIFMDGSCKYEFLLELGLERVVNALEIYRHKGEWKMKAVGAGFMAGLKRLCEQYGIDVE